MIAALLIVGCTTTPVIEGDAGVSSVLPLIGDRTIVVSNFEYSSYYGPVPKEFLADANDLAVHAYNMIAEGWPGDISPTVAAILMARGIPVTVRRDQAVKDLADDEILLTGELLITQPYNFSVGNMLLMFLLLGDVLPSPLPFKEGAAMVYSYEFVNSDGEVIYQARRRRISVMYNHYWVWGAAANRQKDFYQAAGILGPMALTDLLGNFE